MDTPNWFQKPVRCFYIHSDANHKRLVPLLLKICVVKHKIYNKIMLKKFGELKLTH